MWYSAILTQAIIEGRFFRYRKYYYGHIKWKELFKIKKKDDKESPPSAKSSMSKREQEWLQEEL